MSILFKDARLFGLGTAENGTFEVAGPGDLRVEGSRIADISSNLDERDTDDRVVDAAGKWLWPGLIDSHVHFREPDEENPSSSFSRGSRAAVKGGVTTFFDMPNTSPPVDSHDHLAEKQRRARSWSRCNWGCYWLGNEQSVRRLDGSENIVGIKVYMGPSTGEYEISPDELDPIFERAAELGYMVTFHAEDGRLIKKNRAEVEKKRGIDPLRPSDHSEIRSPKVASRAVRRILDVAGDYPQVSLHIHHVSTPEEVLLINHADGLDISFEICPHHLLLTTATYDQHGMKALVNPPLRDPDRVGLLRHAASSADVIGSDHAPHPLSRKKSSYYDEAPSGLESIELMLPLLISDDALDNREVAEKLTAGPADRFGLQDRGRIREGKIADLVLIDPEKQHRLGEANEEIRDGRWTVYGSERRLSGFPEMVLVNGREVYRRGKFYMNSQAAREISV